MNKTYDYKTKEPHIYKKWEDAKAFTPEGAHKLREQKNIPVRDTSYSITLPPPNANAPLHFGHATFCIEDCLIRFKRMQGYRTVWFPGTDHAGFETQVVYERHLKKEGKSRFDFDRETFYNDVLNFVKENSDIAIGQLKQLGMSCDWDRNTFMLDEKVINIVTDTFLKMEKDGMVYRDGYMVNYSPHHGTTFSELETDYQEQTTNLYYVKYKIDNSDETITVATVRPETIYTDVAIAVNPTDERYSNLIGKNAINPLNGNLLPVIQDDYVEKDFGTGALKITPAHDQNDFEICKRHNLTGVGCIDLDGKMNHYAPQVEGKRVFTARLETAEILQQSGAIEKVDTEYQNKLLVDYKDGKPIEPMVLPNWFIKVEDLALRVKEAVENEDVKFNRETWKNEVIRWMDNIKPWPISRQTVFGIRIPAYYPVQDNPTLQVTFIDDDGNLVKGQIADLLRVNSLEKIKAGLQKVIAPTGAKYIVSKTEPAVDCLPETDTFDTWFSSGQWPLTTVNYPEGKDFKEFYPQDVLESGWDIMFFWIARMMMFGLYLTDQVPFKNVYFHNIITASDGKKMSKSKGNVVNPIEIADKYSADSVRMFLLAGVNSSAKYSPYNENEIKGFRNFGNKVWNVARFLEMQLDALEPEQKEKILSGNGSSSNRKDEDKAILEKLNETKAKVTEAIETHEFQMAGQAIYHFIWDDFANGYLETLRDRKDQMTYLPVFHKVLKESLKMLHPFMPFVTEAIWEELKLSDSMLIVEEW